MYFRPAFVWSSVVNKYNTNTTHSLHFKEVRPSLCNLKLQKLVEKVLECTEMKDYLPETYLSC